MQIMYFSVGIHITHTRIWNWLYTLKKGCSVCKVMIERILIFNPSTVKGDGVRTLEDEVEPFHFRQNKVPPPLSNPISSREYNFAIQEGRTSLMFFLLGK